MKATLLFLLSIIHLVSSLKCLKAVGTKDFRPDTSHSIVCMGHVTSCYSLTTKEDVVGHIVEGSEYDCDNQNVCMGLQGACMSQGNSVRCCCDDDNCNKAKRTVVIGSKKVGLTSVAATSAFGFAIFIGML